MASSSTLPLQALLFRMLRLSAFVRLGDFLWSATAWAPRMPRQCVPSLRRPQARLMARGRDSHGADRRAAITSHINSSQPALAPEGSPQSRDEHRREGCCAAREPLGRLWRTGAGGFSSRRRRWETAAGATAGLSSGRELDDAGKVGTVSLTGNCAVASFVHVSQEPHERRRAAPAWKRSSAA